MKVKVMGILNLTPDSFSDGGVYSDNPNKAIKRIEEMLSEGADIIDIGGESTRPGAEKVSLEEELNRVITVIKNARKKLGNDFDISIDTYKSEVARQALSSGASIINSVGGFSFDNIMADIASEFNCQIIIYHINGIPQSMQKGKIVYDNVIKDITRFFRDQIAFGIKKGIKRNKFIIDPGIGFGKTVEQNLEIIKKLDKFKKLNLPILIGISRKNHIGLILQNKLKLKSIPSSKERLEGTLAATAIAVINGAGIVRTHDVFETKKFLTVLEELL